MNDWLLIKAFANANDSEQADLINQFARELFVRCGGRHRIGGCDGYESQVCNISKHLNADGQAFIEDLNNFIQLRKKEMK